MRLVSWNVNGIRAVQRKGLFDPFVAALAPDVICLQETKADEAQAGCTLDGYQQIWHPAIKKGYSGTAILTRPHPLGVTRGLPKALVKKHGLADDVFGNPDDEGRVVTAEYEDLYLVNAYTPNAKGDLTRLALRHERWDPAFRAYLTSLRKKKPVAACGDLNVAHTEDDVANAKSNSGQAGFTAQEREGFGRLLDAGFVDAFRLFTPGPGHYTWWSNFSNARERNVGWRIDYFVVSDSLVPRVVAAEIHADVTGSDHCPVSLTLDL
ncbi:MAG: exodeoxyribonuclease III [Acidimicrobiales bacterium]